MCGARGSCKALESLPRIWYLNFFADLLSNIKKKQCIGQSRPRYQLQLVLKPNFQWDVIVKNIENKGFDIAWLSIKNLQNY